MCNTDVYNTHLHTLTHTPARIHTHTYIHTPTHTGIVRFNGTTDFHAGIWIGVELDVPKGKNDGSVAGKQYFKCEDKYGLFTQPASCQAMNGTIVERLAAYYQTHAPEKVKQTAEILAHFVGKEEELFNKLEQKYGEPVR